MMDWLAKTLFGQVEFPENEEYLEFQYKFVILLQVFAGITSAVFVSLAEIGIFPRIHQLQNKGTLTLFSSPKPVVRLLAPELLPLCSPSNKVSVPLF